MLERLPEQVMTLAWLLQDTLAEARKIGCPPEVVDKLDAIERAVAAMLETAKAASSHREHKYAGWL
jgi:hypothetical protein